MNRQIRAVWPVMIATLIVIVVSTPLLAQNGSEADQLTVQALEKMEQKNEQEARSLLREALDYDPDHLKAIWTLSLLYSKEGFRLDDKSERMERYERGRELAEKCLELDSEEAECHYIYAATTGRIADQSSARQGLRLSKEIREHAERALELDPDHAPSWHLLGVWHTRVANLSRTERFAANALFGGTPDGASNSEAERSLKKAIELEPKSILFHLDLARFYEEVGQNEEAVNVLVTLLELEVADEDDPRYIEDAEDLLAEVR